MSKVHIAVCVGDELYQKRLIGCLFLYYRNEIEVSVYTDPGQLEEDSVSHHAIICGDYAQEIAGLAKRRKEPVVYLVEDLASVPGELVEDTDHIHFMEKYQSVDEIVKATLSWVEREVHVMRETSSFCTGSKTIAVYALSDNEMQLPYTACLASILAEKGKVLVLDLQENSGLSQLEGELARYGLEELMVMAQSEEYSPSRIANCISRRGGIDFVAPLDTSECISEGSASLYAKMMLMLRMELEYDWIILSIGSRFMGFYECLRQCNEVHIIGKTSGLCRWREAEFKEELKRRGYDTVLEHVKRVEIPAIVAPITTCERLIEQWKWNELGDMIRGEAKIG